MKIKFHYLSLIQALLIVIYTSANRFLKAEKRSIERSSKHARQNFVCMCHIRKEKGMTSLSSTITIPITFMSFCSFLFLSRRRRSQRFDVIRIPCFPKRIQKERKRSVEFPLFHLLKFLLITLYKKNYMYASTKRIDLFMCNKKKSSLAFSSLYKKKSLVYV